jgi:uncharacterized membrane protein
MKNDRQVQIEAEQLLALLTNSYLPRTTRRRAYELAFPKPDAAEWQGFLSQLFYSLGGALLVCGLLLFVEHHWLAMSYLHKCSLFGSSTLICAAVAWRKGTKSTGGKVALSCACLLLGGFLIVASRVGETGEWHRILSAWSTLILPCCILAEFAPLWLFATGLFNVTLSVLCHKYLAPWFFQKHYFEIALLLLNVGLLTAWEMGFWRGWTWMGRRWFPPLLTLTALTPLTLCAAGLLLKKDVGLAELFPVLPAIGLSWAGLLFYYSRVRRDVSVLSLTLSSGVFLGTSLIWRFVWEIDDPIAILVLAVGLVVQISMALGILRNLTAALPASPKAPPQETPAVRLWLAQLATEGLLKSQQVEDFELSMRAQNESALPWFVRGLAGLGAFVASVLLLFYLLLAGTITENNGVMFGLGMCALACLLTRVMTSPLVHQACLSISLCGQLTVWLVYALTDGIGSPAKTALVMTFLELALLAGYPGAFGRFLSVNFAGLFLARWISLVAPTPAIDLLVLAVASLVTFLWLAQHRIMPVSATLAPAYAPVAIGAVTLLFTFLLSTISWTGVMPPVGMLTALGLVILTVKAADEMGASPKTLVGLTLGGLICSSAPGVMAAVLVLLLGFYRRNHTLKGMAIVFLLTFGSAYYYHLALSLLVKCAVLSLSGCVFLYTAKGVEASSSSTA